METQLNTLSQFGNDSTGDGTPADLPAFSDFPLTYNNGERLIGLRSDRLLVYHQPDVELYVYDPSEFDTTGELTQVEHSNTSSFGPHQFEEFRTALQDRDWFATTAYAEVFLGGVDVARFPQTLPSEGDQQSDGRAEERLLGVDTWGFAHYEVPHADIPFIRRYVPFKDSEILRWEPKYNGYVTPEDGLDHRRIGHYLATTAVEGQGWKSLSDYGRSLAQDYLDALSPLRELVE